MLPLLFNDWKTVTRPLQKRGYNNRVLSAHHDPSPPKKKRKQTVLSDFETGVYQKQELNFALAYSDFIRKIRNTNTGAVTSFLGVARPESASGEKRVKSLVMESYERHANKALRKICDELRAKYRLNRIIIIHALGRFKVGEPVVLVAVAAARRDSAFEALREAVERYKKEPALFKQEIYVDGSSSWIG
jgi:molybdopterin synthase catalytic subunit